MTKIPQAAMEISFVPSQFQYIVHQHPVVAAHIRTVEALDDLVGPPRIFGLLSKSVITVLESPYILHLIRGDQLMMQEFEPIYNSRLYRREVKHIYV